LRIVTYPYPTLTRPSKPLRRVDAELHTVVRQMFDLMYEKDHRGIGLAANQVDLPYRLFVINLTCDPALRDQEFVFINPVLSQPKGSAEEEEGCLSLPGLYAQVRRPERITVNAYNLAGQEVTMGLEGLFARVVQHETDHLDGVLFIDRLSPTAHLAVREALAEFEADFQSRRTRGEIPSDEQILGRLAELEQLRA
jgi:peptide deformylase